MGAQLVAYGGRDDRLFRGAIIQSGRPTSSVRYRKPEIWQPVYDNITAAVGCTGANNTRACLRTVPTERLSSVLNSSVTAGASWSAQIDSDIIRKFGTASLVAGQFVKVPILNGRNSDEGASFATKGINITSELLAMVQSAGIENATASIIATLYPDIPAIGIPATLKGRPSPSEAYLGAQWKRAAAYTGDLKQHAPRRLESQSWAKYNVSSFSNRFNALVNGVSLSQGACHFQEVAFVFHNTEGN